MCPLLFSWFVILFLPMAMPQEPHSHPPCTHAQANVQDVCGCQVLSGLLSFSYSSLLEEIPLCGRPLINISHGLACAALSDQSASWWLPFPQALVLRHICSMFCVFFSKVNTSQPLGDPCCSFLSLTPLDSFFLYHFSRVIHPCILRQSLSPGANQLE